MADDMQSVFDNVKVVMVNPSHGGNIGAAARAIKTMGIKQLVVVNPDHYPSELAEARASGALDVLESIQIVETFEEAIKDCRLVIGTSGRMRRIPWPLMDSRTCGDVVAREAPQGEVALVFGREARGLTNDELHQCHYHVQIPGNPEYCVLNIAAAIQVIVYEVRMGALALYGEQSSKDDSNDEPSLPMNWVKWDAEAAPHGAVDKAVEHLLKVLEQAEYFDPNEPRQTPARIKRMSHRMRLDSAEVQMMRGMLSAIERKLRSK